ncbi:beta-L-arabinofuranosidase domain-containing protein [Leifsonia sp. 2MCAF36]|uniref:beta-L-arabinofuranosidase domain-containing protein n=1 Tax=Leifsonia sp. 2MCAF36 TaxID=3232988 RepID=UPI003F9D8A31
MTARTAARVHPFALDEVRLGDGSVFARAREQMLHLARVYPVDRLLAVFRANAGLDTRGAAAPGAWEDFGHPNEEPWGERDYPGREAAQTANLLRGHYAGHFLSMLAMAAAGENDPALRAKVSELVAGLAEVQRALAATGRYSHPGFLAAYGEWQFSRLEDFAPYGEIWAPYYTCHKIMAGLLDAWELTGERQALDVATAMGHWVSSRLGRLDDERRQRMWSLYIAGEFGGMNETMARLSVAAGEPLFLETARMFDQRELLSAGAERRDILDGMHANQHLPQLIGYVQEYELTGDRRYLDAAIGIWDQVVPGRMYAHGGTGESELWGPADTVAGDIGHRNAETCATYNLLKLARLLFQHTLEPRYMEYYERGVLNHILGSRRDIASDTSPEVTYMFPVHPGALPEFDNTGTCCGGTGLENHVKYQDTVFFRGDGPDADLWVNLYTDAELDWRDRGLRVRLESGLPFSGTVRLAVGRTDGGTGTVKMALNLRIPGWVIGSATASISGRPVPLDAESGGYATARHDWCPGDVLTLQLPLGLRATGTIDDPRLQSVSFGPSVLVARSESTTTIEAAVARRRMLDGTILADTRRDADGIAADLESTGGVVVAGLRFEPVWIGSVERYHLYVRAADATVGFGGADTGVPARRRADGSTVLDDLWAEPEPRTRAEFLTRALASVRAARRDGLLGGAEACTVLRAALGADLTPDRHVASGTDEERWAAADIAAWIDEPDDIAAPPSVEIVVSPEPSPSGWYTTSPQVEVRATAWDDDAVAAFVEVRIGDGEWRPYRAPVPVEYDGEVRVSARATTASGLTGSASRTLEIDTEPPLTEARVKSLGSGVEISFAASDGVSGVERIQWQGDGTFWATFQEAFVRTLTDHEQVIEYAATDRAGNEEPRRRLVLPLRPAER